MIWTVLILLTFILTWCKKVTYQANLMIQLNGTTHLPGQYVDSPLLSSSLVDHFQGMPRSLIEKLYQIYYDDFLLFNYSIDEFIEVADHTM